MLNMKNTNSSILLFLRCFKPIGINTGENVLILKNELLTLCLSFKTMKNFLYIALALILFSCAKEKDITGKDYTLTATSSIWSTSKLKSANSDSTKFEFFTTSSYGTPFATTYTGSDGKCQVTLKGNTDYWMRCTSPMYKNSSGNVYTYIQCASSFHSTVEQNDKKHTYIPADFTVIFIEGQTNRGVSSTIGTYNDPINF